MGRLHADARAVAAEVAELADEIDTVETLKCRNEGSRPISSQLVIHLKLAGLGNPAEFRAGVVQALAARGFRDRRHGTGDLVAAQRDLDGGRVGSISLRNSEASEVEYRLSTWIEPTIKCRGALAETRTCSRFSPAGRMSRWLT